MEQLKSLFWYVAMVAVGIQAIEKLASGLDAGVMQMPTSKNNRSIVFYGVAQDPLWFWIAAALWALTIVGAIVLVLSLLKGRGI